MRSRFLFAVALILASAHQVTQPQSLVAQSEIESRVRAVVEMRFHAAQAKSVSDVARLYADDVNLLVFRQGQVIRSWAAYERYWQSALKDLPPGFQLQFQNVEMHASSEMAYVTALWTTTYNDKSGEQVARGLMTLILVNKPGGWHIVHEHISAMPNAVR